MYEVCEAARVLLRKHPLPARVRVLIHQWGNRMLPLAVVSCTAFQTWAGAGRSEKWPIVVRCKTVGLTTCLDVWVRLLEGVYHTPWFRNSGIDNLPWCVGFVKQWDWQPVLMCGSGCCQGCITLLNSQSVSHSLIRDQRQIHVTLFDHLLQ
jgi:hypothetical protein